MDYAVTFDDLIQGAKQLAHLFSCWHCLHLNFDPPKAGHLSERILDGLMEVEMQKLRVPLCQSGADVPIL